MTKIYWLNNKQELFCFDVNYIKTSCLNNNIRQFLFFSSRQNIVNIIDNILNFVKEDFDFVIRQKQYQVVLFSK